MPIIMAPARPSTIRTLRAELPFVNYDSTPITDNHVYQDGAERCWKTLKPGYGSRHIHDVADFTLWCEETQDFKMPNQSQVSWILNEYKAYRARVIFPLIIIETDSPPDPLPLTVACVAARFVSDASLLSAGFRLTTAYASPRVPDPSPLVLKRQSSPTKSEANQIILSLAQLCNIKTIGWIGVYCYVELHTGDGRSYETHSLPGYVAGKTTHYHHSETSYWEDPESHRLLKLIDPHVSAMGPDLEDRINYLYTQPGNLQPGIRVSSGQGSNASVPGEKTSSCGVQLRHSTGRTAVTIANHRFKDDTDIYHPQTVSGLKIGTITERWPAQDIAMVDLTVPFSNAEYFAAKAPKRLIRSDDMPDGSWCSCDGMSTGLVFLQCQGARLSNIEMEVTSGMQVDKVRYVTEKVYSVFGPIGGDLTKGLCGAPIVEEGPLTGDQGPGGGGVCSMFRFGNEEIAIAPVLDDIIDAGWELC